MKQTLYAIKDIKSGSFGTPIAEVNEAVLIRQLTKEINENTRSSLYSWPEDFQLFKIGEYNTETGSIEACVEFIRNLGELKEHAERQESN